MLLVVLTIPALPSAAAFAAVPTVGDIASIPRALPQLTLPDLSLVLTLLLPAFSVAVIGLVQGAGVSQGTPNPDGRYPNVSRDFLGQGAANIATSLVGGIPAGGSVSGTALIMSAGASRAGPTSSSACSSPRSCCWPRRWSNWCRCPRWPRC